MTTVLGPAPCHTCRATVWVQRRTAYLPCEFCTHGSVIECHEVGGCRHTHAVPDVFLVTVDENGERHECPA